MLTPTVAAVKFDLPLTPEQKACSAKIDEGLKTFWNLVERMQHAADQQQPIPQVEETLFGELLVIGRWMLQAFLDMAGTGDVGPTLTGSGDSPSDPDQELPRLDQPHKRPYLSIFGAIAIERICYGHDRVEAAPLDAQLHLPQRPYSYVLQQWLGSFVVDDAHAEAIRKLGTILGLEITVRASEDLNREQASDVEVFQDRLPVPDAADEGPLVVVTADGKGVPLNAVFRILRVVTRSRFPATSWGWRPVRQTSLEDGAASCHDDAVFPKTPITTGTAPWLHRVPPHQRERRPRERDDRPSGPSRSPARSASFSPPRSGNKRDRPHPPPGVATTSDGRCSP